MKAIKIISHRDIKHTKDNNLQYEIIKCNSNRYFNEYREYFNLRMWGDIRLKGIEVESSLEVDSQSIYHSYFLTFSEAKEALLKTIELLAMCSKYRNMYIFRDSLNIKIIEDRCVSPKLNTLIGSSYTYILINNKKVDSVRELIESYLVANIKGTGYKVAKIGSKGEAKTVFIEILEDIIKYYIYDINGTETMFKMPKINMNEVLEKNSMIEYFLAGEYIISKIWNAKQSKNIFIEKANFNI